MHRDQSPIDKVLKNGATFSRSNTKDADRGEGHTRGVGSDGLLDNKLNKFEDDDDVFVWKEGEDTEAASRRLYEGDGQRSFARNDNNKDERVGKRQLDQWKYWGEEDHLMGKAGKTKRENIGKAKSSKRCMYKWNRRPPTARRGGTVRSVHV
jgi:hypothetical protein